MSMSVKELEQKIYFVIVPLVLLVGTTIAVWLALFNNSDMNGLKVTLPFFSYQVPETAPATSSVDIEQDKKYAVRDIFKVVTGPEKQMQSVDTHQVDLGLVIVKGEKRFCLTNGVLYKEGEGNDDFTVHSIESNGVRYQVGNTIIFLRTGESANVDGDGNIRE